ncbi:MAG: hypothetical protein GXY82_06145 [Methanospirillum sp.]|nr:hypothetical protein [Methanospirillum sp.]
MKGRPFLRVASLVLLLILSGTAVPGAATTELSYAGRTITISSPGSYVLTHDIAESSLATCIEIRASNVVFDGGGHLVDGTGTGGSIGISVPGPAAGRNVTIRNVRVRDWDYGVHLHGARDSRIESCVLSDNLFGGAVLYLDATGNTVAGCTITGNGYGVVLSSGASGCAVSGSRITGNECGVYLHASDGATLAHNIIAANTEAGLRYCLSGRSTVYDNRFDNTLNVDFTGEPLEAHTCSVEPRNGPNIVGGPRIGGNYWAQPDGTGFSQVIADRDGDGFSDDAFPLASQSVDEHPLAPSVGFIPTPDPTPTAEPPGRTPEPTPTAEPPEPTPVPTTVTMIPFPISTEPGVAGVPGGAGTPTDTDGDRLYDDVNGNTRADFADIVLYFTNIAWIAGNEPLAAFDFNGNGRVDFADAVWLFNTL